MALFNALSLTLSSSPLTLSLSLSLSQPTRFVQNVCTWFGRVVCRKICNFRLLTLEHGAHNPDWWKKHHHFLNNYQSHKFSSSLARAMLLFSTLFFFRCLLFCYFYELQMAGNYAATQMACDDCTIIAMHRLVHYTQIVFSTVHMFIF